MALIKGVASAEQSAAIAAAIARFEAETTVPPVEESAVGAWQRAALLEGVSAKGTAEESEGGHKWLS